MPPPPLIPFIAPLLAGPAAKTCAIVAWDYGSTVTSLALSTVLARRLYRKLPGWVKEDAEFRSFVEKEQNQSEVLSLASVIEKLQDLFASSLDRMDWKFTRLEFHATFLCYLQLNIQLKRKHPELTNKLYSTPSTNVDTPDAILATSDWHTLREVLDYAVWAYDEDSEELLTKLEQRDFQLKHHALTAKMPPGFVGYFTAISDAKKVFLIAVKGTSSLEDLLVDCCTKSTPLELKRNVFAPNRKYGANLDVDTSAVEVQYGIRCYCHDGILIAAKRLLKSILNELQQSKYLDYSIIITGHSLGAGTAALLGLMLKSELPPTTNLHVYAFACPPVLDLVSSKASKDFITTVVNHTDIICRSSLANLTSFLDLLQTVHVKYMEPNGLTPVNARQTLKLFKRLWNNKLGDTLMTKEELHEETRAAQSLMALEDTQHLYVPGKVILLYKQWQTDNVTKEQSEGWVEVVHTPGEDCKYIVTEGDAPSLRFFDIGNRMVTDHFTDSYTNHIDALHQNSVTTPQDVALGFDTSQNSGKLLESVKVGLD